MCGRIQLYIANSLPIFQWASKQNTGNRIPMQNAASKRMNLQNQPMKEQISCVPMLRFASGRRKLCPFMFEVSRLLVFDAALMVKNDISTLMFPPALLQSEVIPLILNLFKFQIQLSNIVDQIKNQIFTYHYPISKYFCDYAVCIEQFIHFYQY